MALKETGELPIGVEVDGVLHRDFTLRPRLVRDSVEVMEDALARDNDAYRGVALIAKQIERLGDLPRDRVTPDLLMSMFDIDMAKIMERAALLEGRLLTFRKPGQKASEASPDPREDRGALGGSA